MASHIEIQLEKNLVLLCGAKENMTWVDKIEKTVDGPFQSRDLFVIAINVRSGWLKVRGISPSSSS